jgi:hypothetical protein
MLDRVDVLSSSVATSFSWWKKRRQMNGFSRMIKEAIVLIALAKAVLHLAKAENP